MYKRSTSAVLLMFFLFATAAFAVPNRPTQNPARAQAMNTFRQENKALRDQMKQIHQQLRTTKDPNERKALMLKMRDLHKQERQKMHEFFNKQFPGSGKKSK